MKDDVKELIAEAERVGAIKIMAPVEWLRWQNERIEQLERENEDARYYERKAHEKLADAQIRVEQLEKALDEIANEFAWSGDWRKDNREIRKIAIQALGKEN